MPLDVVSVDSVEEAAGILAAEAGARFLGGGTLLVRAINAGGAPVDLLVLSDGLGLDRIEVSGNRVTLGGAVTMARVAAHPDLAFLKPVAESIGGPAVRAMATVGGNLFARYPYGDFAVALLALDAAVDSIDDGDGGARIQAMPDFLAGLAESPPCIVRGIQFDMPAAGSFHYTKAVRKRPHGASVLSIAALLPMRDGQVSGARIAYGAMADKPMRATAVESVLEGNRLDAETVARAVAVAADGCAPLTDTQASAWYRVTVLPVHLQRLLEATLAPEMRDA